MTALLGTHWHFAAGDDAPHMNFGKRQKIVVGKTYKIRGTPVPCEVGFHGSVRARDALQYAQGSWLSRVTLSGAVIPHNGDKDCASGRTHHAFVDATPILHEFACWCAEQALEGERKAGREPDERSWAAIEVRRRWLKGEANDKELVAAWAAAGVAAGVAAGDAVRAAAGAAAWAAAGVAAGVAAWAAAGDAQAAKLEEMCAAAFGVTA